jgi:hypothetical protein
MVKDFAVDVVCDNRRRHEKRIVSLATFDRREGRWHIGRRPGERRRARHFEKMRAAGRPSLITNGLLDFQPLVCKLCGERLAGWRDKATMVPVLDRLAVQHDRLVSISQLKDLIANKA